MIKRIITTILLFGLAISMIMVIVERMNDINNCVLNEPTLQFKYAFISSFMFGVALIIWLVFQFIFDDNKLDDEHG